MNLHKGRDYIFYLTEDTYVVWLAGLNRYIQMKEPAFRVFELWANGEDIRSVASYCSGKYNLPEEEAVRFVGEITESIMNLINEKQRAWSIEQTDLNARLNNTVGQARLYDAVGQAPAVHHFVSATSSRPLSSSSLLPFSARICRISGHTCIFKYGNEELEDQFSPLFRQFETDSGNPTDTIELFTNKDNYCIRVNGSEVRVFRKNEWEFFHGAFYTELLNLLYHKNLDDWMGVFHASAISDGNEALVFMAPSGSGKSTLAALMMAHGYQIISDDFVPVSVDMPKVYPVPTAISVKKDSIPFLKAWFPGLEADSKEETFLPFPGNRKHLVPVRIKAIIFIRYARDEEFRFNREQNLAVMNTFLRQSWIADNARTARQFLKWYFQLPLYSMVYSEVDKAIKAISELMENM